MAKRVRIATFNLESLDIGRGEDTFFARRAATLRPQLRRLDADILCLQEINGQRLEAGAPRRLVALDQLLEETPYAGWTRVSTAGDGVRVAGGDGDAQPEGVQQAHNLVILSRFPIAAARQIRHDLVRPPRHTMMAGPEPGAAQDIAWDRPVLHAEIDIGGPRPLHVLNVHLRSPLASPIPDEKSGPFAWKRAPAWAEGFFIASVKRAGQALEARLAVDALFDGDEAALVAVCGDCNAELRETATRLLMAGEDDTGNGALFGRSLVAVEQTLPRDRRFSVVHAGQQVMLDHLLISRALMGHFHEAEIHNEGLGDEVIGYATVDRSPETYHAPLVAEFRFAG